MKCHKSKTVIIKVTHTCNLHCKYCSIGDVNDHKVIDEDIVDLLFKKLSDECNESTIIWHGGEPLVVGLSFYKKMLELQAKYKNHRFKNSIQTNGTLLNEEFMDFFQVNKFSLGFSLDGCELSHNINRPFKGGKKSFDITYKWYKEAERRGMHPGAICVLNANTAQYIKEIYEFAKENKIAFKFNPQYPAGRASINLDLGLNSQELAKAYIALFNLWFDDNPQDRANINMFDRFVESIIKISNNKDRIYGYDCAWANRCQKSFIGLSIEGDIFPCGKFVDNPEFLYGNIKDNRSLSEILDNSIRKQFLLRHENGVSECNNCRYLKMCSSGCPHTSYLYTNDILSKNPFCESNLLLFKHIESRLIEQNRNKDIFIEPIDGVNEYLVYSPLRGSCFIVGNNAKLEIEKYLTQGVQPTNNQLATYMHGWASQLPMDVQENNIDTINSCVILLTQQCNLKCSYCYSKESRSAEMLTKETISTIVDNILNNSESEPKRFSFIGGGEPTLNWPLLVWSIEYIRRKQKHENVNISVTTNGTLLTEERVIWLKEFNVEIGLSYDILPNVQDSTRMFLNGAGTYKKVDETIKLLHKYNLRFRIRATVTNDSVDLLPQMIEFIRDNYPYISHVQLEPVQDKSHYISSFYDKFIDKFLEAYIIGLDSNIEVYNMITRSIQMVKKQFCRGEFCITPDGMIVACQRFSSERDNLFTKFRYGKVINGEIKIDNKLLTEIKNRFAYKQYQCDRCFAKYHCAGICTALRSDMSNEQILMYCGFIKRLIKQMLLKYLNYKQ